MKKYQGDMSRGMRQCCKCHVGALQYIGACAAKATGALQYMRMGWKRNASFYQTTIHFLTLEDTGLSY